MGPLTKTVVYPHTRRRTAIVVCNAVLVFSILGIFVSGLHSLHSFEKELGQYGLTPAPFNVLLVRTLREKIPDFVLTILLIWGAIAEMRHRRESVVVNSLLYAAIAVRTIWDSISAARGPEFIPLLVLAQAVLFLLVPIIGLLLYRRGIAILFARLNNIARSHLE